MQTDVLAALDSPALSTIALSIATTETISTLAPTLVTTAGTLDFRTLVPERGGLFDHRVFGPGTVIDAAPELIGAPFKRPKTWFARYELVTRPMPHPLCENGRLAALPILPPDLRPLHRLADDRWKVTGLNEVYQRLIMRDARGARASIRTIDPSAPAVDPRDPAVDPDFERDMGELVQRLLAELYVLAGGRAAIVEALVACDARGSLEPTTGGEYRALAALAGAGVHAAIAGAVSAGSGGS